MTTVRSATPIHVRIGRPRPKRHHSPSAPSSWRRHGRGCRGRLPPHLPRIRSPPRAPRTRCPGHHLGHWCLASRGRHVGRTLTFLGSGSGYACPCWFDGLIDQSAVGVGIVPTGSETSPVVQPATGTTGSERPTALAFIDNIIPCLVVRLSSCRAASDTLAVPTYTVADHGDRMRTISDIHVLTSGRSCCAFLMPRK